MTILDPRALKPCPFCNGEVELGDENIFVCSGCGANVSLYSDDIESEWNRRALSQPQAGEAETPWGEIVRITAPQPALAVEGLKWEEYEANWWGADTGSLRLGYEVRLTDSGTTRIRLPSQPWDIFEGSPEAAKAAAQADYETRIRSALVASPQPESSGAVEAQFLTCEDGEFNGNEVEQPANESGNLGKGLPNVPNNVPENENIGAVWRIETGAEHIARDMREGRFPAQSAPQMVLRDAVVKAIYLDLAIGRIDQSRVRAAVEAALSRAPATADGWRTKAADDVLAERKRQVEAEGWTPEHDDTHGSGEMATAAACYALVATGFKQKALWEIWPKAWGVAWFKSATSRRNLVKAGALILAEIERLDRLPAAPTATGGR